MAGQEENADRKLLLSPNSVKYLVWSIKMCTWVKAVPYTYDEKTKRFLFDDSSRMRTIWTFHNFMYNLYMTYVGLRWVENALIDMGGPKAMGSMYVALNYQCVNSVQISVTTAYGSHHQWLNMLFDYLGDLQESQGLHLKTSRSVSNDCGPLLRIFFITSFMVFSLDTYSMWYTPHQPFFVSSIMAHPEKLTSWEKLPFATFHVYIWVFQWCSILFYYTCIIAYLTGIQNALEALRCTIVLQKAERIKSAHIPIQQQGQAQIQGQQMAVVHGQQREPGNPEDEAEILMQSILGEAELLAQENDIKEAAQKMKQRQRPSSAYELIGQNPAQFFKEYRTIEILQNFCNKIWGTCNACYEVSFIIGSVLGFYNAVTMEKDRAFHQFAVGIFFTYTLMMIWQQMGSIFEQSTDVLWGWQFGNVERPWFRKFMKSARPIRTNIGGFFYADRGIRLTILAIIFERTTSLLLSS